MFWFYFIALVGWQLFQFPLFYVNRIGGVNLDEITRWDYNIVMCLCARLLLGSDLNNHQHNIHNHALRGVF